MRSEDVGETKETERQSLIVPTLFGLTLDKLVIVFALYFLANCILIFALFSLHFIAQDKQKAEKDV